MCLGPASRLFRFFFIADLRTRQWTPVRRCEDLFLPDGLLIVLVRQSVLVLTMFHGLLVLVPRSMRSRGSNHAFQLEGSRGSNADPDDP